MNKVKLKKRLENALEAFFDDEKLNQNTALDFIDCDRAVKIEENKSFKEKYKGLLNVLKQVLLFFPATFFTFYLWMGMMLFGLPTVHISLFLSLLIFSPLLMVFGLGGLRKLKHWLMPLSVIALGSLIGIGMNSLPILRKFILDFNNAVLFFPLALILAVLSKNWLDNKEEKDSL